MNDDSLIKYYNWLRNGAIRKGQEIIEALYTSEDSNSWDYSVEVPADISAPHYRHLCFTHHGIMFCVLIFPHFKHDPKRIMADDQVVLNLLRECKKNHFVPLQMFLDYDTLELVTDDGNPFYTLGDGKMVHPSISEFDNSIFPEVTDQEMRVHAVSSVLLKLAHDGYINFTWTEVEFFCPEIRCEKDGKKIAFCVKSTPTGLADEPYEINIQQIQSANVDECYLAEVVFDSFRGNNGNFHSSHLFRGHNMISSIKRIIPIEDVKINIMEKEFLLKLAETYQKYDASIIEPYLAEDMHYASMWVFHEMTSKQEYLEYLNGKLRTMKRNGVCLEFLIVPGGMHKQGLLVLNQQAPEGEMGGFVVDFNQEGKVKMLNITIQSFF